MGYFTVCVYGVSWLTLLKASIEAFQVGNKLTLVIFLLPTILFRISCFIGLVTFSTFWSILIFLPLLIANICVLSRHRKRSQTGIHFWTSVICSTFITSIIPEDPSKKEKTGKTSIDQDSAVSMVSTMSLVNIPIIFLATVIIYCLVQFNPDFKVDPCIKLDSNQLAFFFYNFILPLFTLSMLVTVWFYITQTEREIHQTVSKIMKTKFVKIAKKKYNQLPANFIFLGLFITIIISNALLYPARNKTTYDCTLQGKLFISFLVSCKLRQLKPSLT